MTIFDVLTLVGGLSLFLFGMNIMGQALERRAGNSLRSVLGKMTGNKAAGLLTGLGVTAVIQSSSATTVMAVGFVNSGLMTLKQAINVIMGANVGTTITAWILSLSGISSDAVWIQLLKPTSFTPVLAVFGIVFYMFCQNGKKKDTGTILLGFATLMFGMDTMSGAVAGLRDVPAFQELFVLFTNPILGVLAGAVLTAIIQSSSASVGILQALAVTGKVTYGAAVPIIMGQNIGTCITAMLSSVGANKNAKRTALVHLAFNVIGTVILLAVFWVIKATLNPVLLTESASMGGIAVAHSVFNVACTLILLPMSGLLEKLVIKLVPDDKKPDEIVELDERLLATPPLALERCHAVAVDMAKCAVETLQEGLAVLKEYSSDLAKSIAEKEEKTDRYEDMLSTYLVNLSTRDISAEDSREAAKLLKIIGDFERISDHGVNLLDSAQELHDKKIQFTDDAAFELSVIEGAVNESLELAYRAFVENDLEAAALVEPLEQIIDRLKEKLRTHHIVRLQQGGCSIEAGFVWSDLLTNLERTSDHCSNIAGCVIDMTHDNLNLHESLRSTRHEPTYKENFERYAQKYTLKREG